MAAEGFRRVGRALRRPPAPWMWVGRRVRRATHAQGAGESGLGKLIELHAVNSAGDMLITVALASTIFFSVPTDEARGRVALYLAVTMAPFAVLAPVIGPLLDRVPHGRRAAMAGAMLARALLAVLLAVVVSGAVGTGRLELYPAALGVLVASKAYGVVRSAVVPRLLPPRVSLVRANSRVTLSGLLATGAAAPAAAGLHTLGPGWPLVGACALFLVGTVLSLSLDRTVDSAKGERTALLTAREPNTPDGRRRWTSRLRRPRGGHRARGHRGAHGGRGARADRSVRARGRAGARGTGRPQRPERPGLRTVGGAVRSALTANSALRALSGFLTFFLAFLLRDQPLSGLSAATSLAVAAVAAGAGNALGTAVGAGLRARGPEVIIVAVLLSALAAAVVTTLLYGTVTVPALAATAGLAQALGKLSLDALIQRDVPEEGRTSAFARSETLMQMSWVVGGAIGIALPLIDRLGTAVGGALALLGLLGSVGGLLSTARRGTPHPRVV